MESKNLQGMFIDKLNVRLPTVDFVKLDQSCNSEDTTYAGEVLKLLHDSLVETYGTDYLDDSHEFVELPAVIRGRNTGHIGLGIVSLDLQSSGEHWGTFFLTPKGVIAHGSENVSKDRAQYLKDNYVPYEYWYTATLERDYHVNFENIPEKVSELLNACNPDQPGLIMK